MASFMDVQFWTDFADSAVMMPLGFAVAAALALLGLRRPALAWVVAVGGAWAVMLLLKFMGYFVSILDPVSPLSAIDLVTPSGHVASATVIYAGLAGLLLRGPGTIVARTTVVAIVVAVGIGVTRVLLHEHSISESVVGGLVGIVAAAALALMAGGPLETRRMLPVLAMVGLIVAVRHGVHLSWEDTIRQVATQAVTEWRVGV